MKAVNLQEGDVFYVVVGEGTLAARVMVLGGVMFMDSDIKDVQLNNKMARVALNLQEANLELKRHLKSVGESEDELYFGDVDSEGGSHD